MKKFSCILPLLFPLLLYAQAPIAFERYYDFGVGNAEEGMCVQQTNDHGYIIVGRQTVNFQTMYIMLQKTDSLGNLQWMKELGNQYMNFAYSVRQTIDGGFILTGFTFDANGNESICLVKTDTIGDTLWARNYSPTTQNAMTGTDVLQTSDGGYLVLADVVDDSTLVWTTMILKTDSVGNILWTKKYPSYQGNSPGGITQTFDGGYIIATFTNPSVNNKNFYLIKTDAVGDTLWTKTIFHPNGYYYLLHTTNCIQQTSDGGYFLTGTIVDSTMGTYNIIAVKTDAIGDTLWTRTYGGSGEDWAWGGGLQASDGGYIIAGITNSFGHGGLDAYLIKTSSNGSAVWTKTFGGWNDEYANYVVATSDGGYALCGQATSWGDGISAYLVKTDSLGNAPTGFFLPFASQNDISIYPNPFTDFTTVHFSDQAKFPCDLTLYDFSGREVLRDQITETAYTIERNNLTAGIYFCSIKNREGKILCNKKIIVQ